MFILNNKIYDQFKTNWKMTKFVKKKKEEEEVK